MSGGKKEAFARLGASNATIARGINVVFFMVLFKKSANKEAKAQKLAYMIDF
jgi:hypothetical protein